MKRLGIGFCLMIILAAGFFACSGTGPGMKKRLITYNSRVGTGTGTDIKTKTQRIFIKHQFQVVRFEETYDEIFFETDWKYRVPFEDEYELNVADARTRIIIRSNPRTRTYASGYDLHTVTMIGENQVRYAGSQEWMNKPMSDMLVDFFNRIKNDLKTELETGIRIY
ncbi:MAG TPA: hypothetical protein ENN03_10890 [bacterium]|nr:hypothetical protein [bacterium]